LRRIELPKTCLPALDFFVNTREGCVHVIVSSGQWCIRSNYPLPDQQSNEILQAIKELIHSWMPSPTISSARGSISCPLFLRKFGPCFQVDI
ncbi:hypothetical protein T310_7432, partial [Rasamsonia emersonii CBS 393.64]